MPVVRSATPALAWRYPTRTPARVMKPSPPTPDKATAASAHSETDSRDSPRIRRKDDPARIGIAALGFGGANPDAADARPSAITSSFATPIASLVPGSSETPASDGAAPEIPASGRSSGNREASDAAAAADNPRPTTASAPPTTGCTPATPSKKEYRSEGNWVSGTTAPTIELSTSCANALTLETGPATFGTGAPTTESGATGSEPAPPDQKPAPPDQKPARPRSEPRRADQKAAPPHQSRP